MTFYKTTTLALSIATIALFSSMETASASAGASPQVDPAAATGGPLPSGGIGNTPFSSPDLAVIVDDALSDASWTRSGVLIGNTAIGSVEGSIFQDTTEDNIITLEVGSISADHAVGNYSRGSIRGNVNQIADTEGQQLHLSVGSITADYAVNNAANGTVGGDVMQFTQGRGSNVQANIGSIEAFTFDNGQAVAVGNRALGYVEGGLTQMVRGGSQVKANVGNVTNRR